MLFDVGGMHSLHEDICFSFTHSSHKFTHYTHCFTLRSSKSFLGKHKGFLLVLWLNSDLFITIIHCSIVYQPTHINRNTCPPSHRKCTTSHPPTPSPAPALDPGPSPPPRLR